MAARNANPALDIYSEITRAMLHDRGVTPARMDNVAHSLATCNTTILRVNAAGAHAVLRAPWRERTCPLYLFVKQNGRWRPDLEPMMRPVRFGRNNAWHLDLSQLSTYRFGFLDLVFGKHGFPIGKR